MCRSTAFNFDWPSLEMSSLLMASSLIPFRISLLGGSSFFLLRFFTILAGVLSIESSKVEGEGERSTLILPKSYKTRCM